MAKSGLSWAEKIGFALLLVVVVMIFNRSSGGGLEPIPPGTPLPEIMAEGWLNVRESPVADAHGSPGTPSRENLKGKVVLVDCWATWCPPCRASMPKLAKIYERYQPLGVEFVGLTPETADEKPAIEGFVGTVKGFIWPVGYGTNPTLDMLGVQVLPTMAVFGKDGLATWSSTSTQGLEAALDEALAR
jgi:thiol-disulfide isomerase/thioredoxin